MKEQVRQRIESLERELQGLKDELQPEVEVGSWWFADYIGRVEVLRIGKKKVYYKFKNGVETYLPLPSFLSIYTPCEAPKKDTWYLCTKDLGENNFMRGKEYKMSSEKPLTLIDEEGFPHRLTIWKNYFVSPQER